MTRREIGAFDQLRSELGSIFPDLPSRKQAIWAKRSGTVGGPSRNDCSTRVASARYHVIMRVLLTHNTALSYLRTQQDGVRRRTMNFDENDHARGWLRSVVESVEAMGLAGVPVHLATDRGSLQGKASGIQLHEVCPQKLPPRSFVPVGNGIASASPELCFVQLATTVPFVSLVSVGYELCGSYSLAIGTERGFLDRAPLTSTDALEAYLSQIPGMRGATAARQALSYVLDASASPMETALAMLLTLPTSHGGYGFELPKMNGAVAVPEALQGRIGASVLHCDLLWEEQGVVMEYDSDRYHTGPERIERDAQRKNNLRLLGYEVLVATRRQVVDAYRFEGVAELLAQCLGRRLRIRRNDFDRRRHQLRAALFSRSRLVL